MFIIEQIKKIEHHGKKLWSSRQLSDALGYQNYRAFLPVIRKAKLACMNSRHKIEHHFHHIAQTIYLSKYACCLVIENANPAKEAVALSQSYLAEQKQDHDYAELETEELSRLLLRNEMIQHNKKLAQAARKAGVVAPEEFSAFQNQGYMGLYNGLDRKHLHVKKQLKASQKILDYMGSTELAANLFRATQTEEKLIKEKVHAKLYAYKIHQQVGEKIRQTIQELEGTLPEELPVPDVSVKEIERKHAKLLKGE